MINTLTAFGLFFILKSTLSIDYLPNSEKKKFETLNKNAKSKLEIALKSFDLHYPNTKDEFQLRRRQQILKAISIIGNTTECMKSNNNQAEPPKKGPLWSTMPLADPCSDSLSELAEFDFKLLQDNVALTEEEGKFAKEILDVTKFTLDVKSKSKDNKPESLNLKPNFDLHLAKMQAIADRFTAPKPEVDSKRYQVENVSLKLNGKTTQLKHFILGYEGDFTINLNEFSEENIKDNSKDKLLFVGAQASKKELLAVHGTIKDVKTVYDYLSPKKGKLTGKQLYDIFVDKNGKHITPLSRCDEVAKLINKYADKFEITMPLRMAHFLGQIGIETGGLKHTKEIPCYKEKAIRDNFGYKHYCDLFEGFDCVDLEACATKTEKVKCSQGTPTTKENIKQKYICTPDLFDYVYSCSARLKGGDYDLGNGPPSSKDGSTFLGRGFIQLTGKSNYKSLSDAWNNDKENDNNKKYFNKKTSDGGHIDELETDLDVAMKASMYYWKLKGCNSKADDDNTAGVTKKVKGSDDEKEVTNREKIKNKAIEVFKK